MLTPEQLAAAHKANIEMLYGLTRKAFEGVEKLVELNLQATKAALRDSADHTQALLSAKDAQELLQRQAALLQPLAEKAVAYSRQLYDIAASTGSAFAQAAEDNAADAQRKALAVMDNVAKNAPAGTEAAVEAMRSAVQAASSAMETIQQAVKQAAELAETQFHQAAQQAQQSLHAGTAAPKSAPRARRSAG
ncbi:phasin: phasin family protein [Tepidimonas thermarum]|uniref:Phasin: phasin family protein n=1 Tax=Tepidimonas thermarum TaxID=335431 RepID=A0A554X5R6_9BURK|nr:TIGR01841 family phasin [Tepidimonas thermarum]TSE31168.1 phasin: phasin family protein [Tepidimonas thermarum]